MRVTVGFVGGEKFKMEAQWADAVRDLGKVAGLAGPSSS